MSLINTVQRKGPGLEGSSLNRYRLEIPSCDAALDVEDFSGLEMMSGLYRYDVTFTCPEKDLHAAHFLRQSVTLTMGTGPLLSITGLKRVHGVTTHFERVKASPDQATYRLILEPYLALLRNQFRTHRFFINQSVPEVVKAVLAEHKFKDWEYAFNLKGCYPKREQINQYQESDLAFVERLLAEVGIFYFFTLQPDTLTEVLQMADAQRAWRFGKTLPLIGPSGTHGDGVESVWDIHVHHQVVEASVTAGDYNHRAANKVLLTPPADRSGVESELQTYGDVWHYRPKYLSAGNKHTPDTETGNFWARLEHERYLSRQTLVVGSSTDYTLAPAEVVTISPASPIQTLPAALENDVVIVRASFTASRKDALQVNWEAVPFSETRCWRPAAKPRPVVSGTLMARVTSAKAQDSYAHLSQSCLYWVRFDADRDDKPKGYESMPVRLAKPYGGDTFGIHFPLIQGTEVAIAFHEGDPDRPYIAHALHDSYNPDHVTADNNTRNVIRTAGLNKLRMEDRRGEQHIKLSTEYGGKTQLNLGHNVDAQRVLRGEGAELRTDDWLSLRGGKGVFISADKQTKAQGHSLDMDEAIRQLSQALSLAQSLNKAAQTAKATPGEIDSQQQLDDALGHLKEAGILAHAPEGIAVLSQQAIRLASGSKSIGLMSGKNTDISAGRSFTVAAEETVRLFAQGAGMQLFAGSGKVDIQAMGNALDASALEDVTISSTENSVTINASKALILNCGGAYIKLSEGNIELGCPKNIFLKATNVDQTGPATRNTPPLTFPKGYQEKFTLKDPRSGEIKPFTRYKITTGEGDVFFGASDDAGKTSAVHTSMPASLQIEFPDELPDEGPGFWLTTDDDYRSS